MYEFGTEVRYHGSIDEFHGEIFIVGRHCCGGTRHVLVGAETLRHVRAASITPAETLSMEHATLRFALTGAIMTRLPAMITYVAADGEWTTRTIEPYDLAETAAGHLIVRAMDRRSGEPRTFRLDRIQACNVLDGTFLIESHAPDPEEAALARIRAELAQVAPTGYGDDDLYGAARWTPGDPIL